MAASLPTSITTAKGGEKIRKAPIFDRGFMKKELLSGVYNLTGELNVSKQYLPSQHRCEFARQPIEKEIFFEAIAKANYQAVKKMIHNNPDLGLERGIAGDTGLHIAAARGLAKLTKFLLQVSELDAVNEAGWSALHLASMNGEAKCAEILCAAGSSLKLADHTGALPEDLALRHTTWSREQLKLWQRPPKPEAPPPPTPRRPPLRRRTEADDKLYEYVEAQDSVTLLDYLTDTRYNVNVYDNCDEFIDVIGFNYTSVKQVAIIKQEDISESEDDSDNDSDEEGGLLGERQTEVAVITKPNTRTPLLLEVAHRGHARMVELLLQFGAQPDAGDAHGVTPLMAAAAGGHTPALEMIMEGLQKMVIPSLLHTLIDVKCEVVRDGLVIRDLSGRSALLIAAARLEPKCFSMLLGIGASTKVLDANGMTCLHLACITTAKIAKYARELRAAANISHEITKNIVLEAEADEKVSKPRTKSPSKMLLGLITGDREKGKRDKVVAAAEKESKKAELKASGMEKQAKEATRTVLELMRLACDVYKVMENEVRNQNKSTLLHLAARDGVEDLVMALVKEKKFQVDSIDDQGRTALHLACANAHLNCATTLLRFGADPHALTYSLATPLSLAAKIVDVFEAQNWVELFETELEKRREAKRQEELRIKKEQEKEIQRKFEEAKKRRELLALALLPELRGQMLPHHNQDDGETHVDDEDSKSLSSSALTPRGDNESSTSSQLSLPPINTLGSNR